MGDAFYEVRQADTITLVDAHSGARLSPLNEETARQLAQSLYTGDAPILKTELVTEAPPEVGGAPVPMWRVEFADNSASTLYISPKPGDLIAKRHDMWRSFDFPCMYHTMER